MAQHRFRNNFLGLTLAGPEHLEHAEVAAVEVLDPQVVVAPGLQVDLAPILDDDRSALPVVDDGLAVDPDADAVVVPGPERIPSGTARRDLSLPASRVDVLPARKRRRRPRPREIDRGIDPLDGRPAEGGILEVLRAQAVEDRAG